MAQRSRLLLSEMPHLLQGMEDRSVVLGEAVALQCKAMGSPPPRITWLRGGEPLQPTERHHFTHANQLLVISSTTLEDAGRYTCVMSNPLGTERAQCSLTVIQRPGANCHLNASSGAVTIGIVVIAVVTSVVATSLVWVCIIYQTRKKSEECSVNTDETIVPPDVPSYLSSQGTLSERQDVCIRIESSGGSQPSGHTHSNGGFDVPVLCTDCMENSSSYTRPSDYHCQGITTPSGTEFQQIQFPSSFGSHIPGEGHCNGTPNGIRKEAASHKKDDERKGSVASETGKSSPSEIHHRPLKQTSVPSPCTDTKLKKTLLPNGHTHLSETTPLRRASD